MTDLQLIELNERIASTGLENIKNIVVITNNTTNGDVIKMLFPEIETTEFAITIHATKKVVCNGVKGGISYDFWKEWWNAPYEREV